MNKKIGTALIAIGMILVLSAVALFGYNRYEERKAADSARDVLAQFQEKIPHEKKPIDATMSTLEINGYDYIGYLSIPDLNVEVPIMDTWDYTRLRIAPCHYYGSYKTDDLVLAGHNYRQHFGGLRNLTTDSAVYFTDADGKIHSYKVVSIEILKPNDTLEMIESDFDLTLFTCTYRGRERVTIRCERIK